MNELVLKDLELMEKVHKSKNGKLYIYKNDLALDRFDDLWEAGYLFKAVSWFNKDYSYQLTKDGLRLVTARIG